MEYQEIFLLTLLLLLINQIDLTNSHIIFIIRCCYIVIHLLICLILVYMYTKIKREKNLNSIKIRYPFSGEE